MQTIIGGPHSRCRRGRQVSNAGEKHCHLLKRVYIISATLVLYLPWCVIRIARLTCNWATNASNKNQLRSGNCKANLKCETFRWKWKELAAVQTSWQTFLIVCSRCYRLHCKILENWQWFNQRTQVWSAPCTIYSNQHILIIKISIISRINNDKTA